MELSWLEDFRALCLTKNFSKAAEARHVTQPTLSRRIQSLEVWLGVPLIDRRVSPISLTQQGKSFAKTAEDVVQSLYRERDVCRGISRPMRGFVSFAMVQSIATDFFPTWLQSIEADVGPLRVRVASLSLHDCVQALVAGSCDIVIGYAAKGAAELFSAPHYRQLTIAEDVIVPVSGLDANGRPLFRLDEDAEAAIPYLAYAQYASLSGFVDAIVQARATPPKLDLSYESGLASALKAMAVRGRGVAWLPYFAVEEEISRGRLGLAGDETWFAPLQINAYRIMNEGSQDVARIWRWMESKTPIRSSLAQSSVGTHLEIKATTLSAASEAHLYPAMGGRRGKRM